MIRTFLAVGCLLAFASTSFGSIFTTATGAKVGGVAVKAQAELSLDSGFLTIKLTNLATTGKNTQRLTNFEFDVGGASAATATISLGAGNAEGSVLVAGGSSVVGGTSSENALTNISGGWVFGTGVTPYTGATPWTGSFDYGVSATSFQNGTQVARFDGSTDFGNTHPFGQVNGGDWGLIGNNFSNVNGPSVVDTVLIKLKVTGTLSLADIKNTAFTYGSEQEGVGGITGGFRPGEEVPEPASMAIWGLGMGLAFVGARFRRKLVA